MRTLLAVLLASAFLGQSAPSQPAAEEERVLATVRIFVHANEVSDLDLMMSTFAEGATLFNPVGDKPYRLVGKQEIRSSFEEIFKRRTGPITITPTGVNVQVFGDIAIVTAHLGDVPPLPLKLPISFARRTFVLHREGDKWLIVHHHASNFQWNPPKD